MGLKPGETAARIVTIAIMGLGILAFGLVIGGHGGWILPGLKSTEIKSNSDDARERLEAAGDTVDGRAPSAIEQLPIPDQVPRDGVAEFAKGAGRGVMFVSAQKPSELVEFYNQKMREKGWRELPVGDFKQAKEDAPKVTWGPAGAPGAQPLIPPKEPKDPKELPDPDTKATAEEAEEVFKVFAGPGQVLYVTVTPTKEGTSCSLLMVQR